MVRPPPRPSLPATLFPYTTLFRSRHLGTDRLHPAARSRHRTERLDRASNREAQGTLLHAGIVERTDDGGDSDTITAELLQGPLLDRPPGLAPERSEEHTSELQSLMRISSAVFCLKKKKKKTP